MYKLISNPELVMTAARSLFQQTPWRMCVVQAIVLRLQLGPRGLPDLAVPYGPQDACYAKIHSCLRVLISYGFVEETHEEGEVIGRAEISDDPRRRMPCNSSGSYPIVLVSYVDETAEGDVLRRGELWIDADDRHWTGLLAGC